MMLRFLVMFILVLSGCGSRQVASSNAEQNVQVRYRNLSREEFILLETDMLGVRSLFKNVTPGVLTGFVKVPKAHAYPYVKVVTGRDTLELQPVAVGEGQMFTQGYMTINLDIATNADNSRELVIVRNGAVPVRDHHTTASDVIDNLFVFINAKDWQVVQDFYAPNAVVEDQNGKVLAATPVQYFQELFAAEDIYHIYVNEQRTSGEGVFVRTMTRKGARSAEYPYCYSFIIANNRIQRQRAVTCTR